MRSSGMVVVDSLPRYAHVPERGYVPDAEATSKGELLDSGAMAASVGLGQPVRLVVTEAVTTEAMVGCNFVCVGTDANESGS